MKTSPDPDLLPSRAQLRRRAILAGLGALAIGLMVYLPAEYGRDPTGVGNILGLTEMGEIKQQLAAEAAADAATHASADAAAANTNDDTPADIAWQDEITFTLAPGEATEVKATMAEGAALTYAWTTSGGRINYDLHAHAGENDVTYKVDRGQRTDAGQITTPFAGNHGWFWRNRDSADVTVTLRLSGDYSGIVWED